MSSYKAREIIQGWLRDHQLTVSDTIVVPTLAKPIGIPNPNPTGRTEVRLEKTGGTFGAPALLNGAIPIKFIVDSGASDVSLPSDIVLALIRSGTLISKDFIGTTRYRLADGSVAPSVTFRLRSIMIGDRIVENVTASVSGVEAPPLLGQSFLGRFERWSINNKEQILVLER